MADVSITASAVQKTATTVVERYVAAVTIAAGNTVYKDGNNSNRATLADADLSQAAAAVVGMALDGGDAGQTIEVAIDGDVTLNAGLTAGTVYVQSATAGKIAPSADMDTATTWYCSVVGVSTSTTNLRLGIRQSGAINA
jgi:hypothetical protein